ncbi:TetR family transcriptional regulator C-terminal domain-containing protein [Paenisporosarcina sp. FSL H8-0542]|uniref:TetR/AcrR family transcriptional regulator n=1 Tax=Paenisporosarcina sp. FSL H8-0542 TaxID=2921401 RepID=UPI00315A75C2
MPKQVNHEERRQIIAEATWEMIMKKGIEGTTVRAIADEANLSLGALRHYFSSQEELLSYSMELVKERVTERIEKKFAQDIPMDELLVHFSLEIIPLDDQSRLEMTVWFHFMANVQFRHKFEGDDGILQALEQLLSLLEAHGRLKPGIELQEEIETLYALVDGLAIHCLFAPVRLTRERIVPIIVKHVNLLLLHPLNSSIFL